jgi:hypothetical protein
MNSPRMVRTMLPVAERAALACNAAYPLPRPSLGTEVGPTKGSPLGSKSFPSARGRAEPLLKSVPSPSIADAMQGIVTDSSSFTSVPRPTLPGAGASPSVARRSYAQQRMRCGRPPLRIGTAARVDPIELQHARNNLGATIRGSDQQARSCSIGCLRTRTAEVASRLRPRRGRRRMDPKSAASTRRHLASGASKNAITWLRRSCLLTTTFSAASMPWTWNILYSGGRSWRSAKNFRFQLLQTLPASLCLVLPPMGSARSAILLLECVEQFVESVLFSNPETRSRYALQGDLTLVVQHCWR